MREAKMTTPHTSGLPSLWNPNAACNWCLIFFLTFGSYIHMLNWTELGERERAHNARLWFFASCAFLVVYSYAGVVSAENSPIIGKMRLFGVALTLSWYFISGRPQVRYVSERHQGNYAKLSWTKPLCIAALINFVVVVILSAVAD